MEIRTEKKNNTSVVYIEKDLTISGVSALKDTLLQEIAKNPSLVINLESVEEMDIAGLQLLCSANRTVEKNKKKLVLETGQNNEVLRSYQIESGYDPSGGCPDNPCKRCLWKGD